MMYRINGLAPMTFKNLRTYIYESGMIDKVNEKYVLKNQYIPKNIKTKNGSSFVKSQKIVKFDTVNQLVNYLIEIGTVQEVRMNRPLQELSEKWVKKYGK